MTFRYPNEEGIDTTYYTDGLGFIDGDFNLPAGIPGASSKIKSAPHQIHLEEGLWRLTIPFRLCIYSAKEIKESSFLDINKRIYCNPCFLYLEKEINFNEDIDPLLSGGFSTEEWYYNITFLDKEGALNLLKEDLTIFDKGNMYTLYNKIQLIHKFLTEDEA